MDLSLGKRRTKKKRDSPLISYLVGDGQTIDQIAAQLSKSLESYNDNFRKISHHNLKVDRNLNLLAKLGENLTAYEKYNYQTTVISSVLAAWNHKRLQKSLHLANGLQRLKSILRETDIKSLHTVISNSLLEIKIPCQIQQNKCVVHSYLTQAA